MKLTLKAMPRGRTQLTDSPFKMRYELNRTYLMSLTELNLLRNYYIEAGLWSYSGSGGTTPGITTCEGQPEGWHWGWEAVTSELRGHFLGHWLSAAAMIIVQSDDVRVKVKADYIINELSRCQQANGGEWLGPFPESYLTRIAAGKWVWAPQYTLHKLLMGLFDMYALSGNEQALEVMTRFADWFFRWTGSFTAEQLDDLMDFETGGMLEVWADLYAVTKNPQYKELMLRYDRKRFFDPLLSGQDMLTNKHANTQIPEILGAARVWEVVGDSRWRGIVEAFWQSAVEQRQCYCTGGISCGEIWTPPGKLSGRLGSAQEHCSTYNMMRLAHILFQWTGDFRYADFWERNLYNGILAQQHPQTGMISYFLDMGAGSKKTWGLPTEHFWCCHGTLLQAQASYDLSIFFEDQEGLIVSQYIPATLRWSFADVLITIELTQESQAGLAPLQKFSLKGLNAIQNVHVPPIPEQRPDCYVYGLQISCEEETAFTVKLRVPWWVKGEPIITVNGELEHSIVHKPGVIEITRAWYSDVIRIVFNKALTTVGLPDRPDMVAFMDGPLVLAGLVDEERQLIGSLESLDSILTPHNERHHSWWNAASYRTVNQERGMRFIPVNEVVDEAYTIYFPIRSK
ncbi:beta-L-arabinofuranosidase domain-containing protein [Paenibacillus sp. Soil787]|uniref:beta-L-arabinofuranosidase domain-containing protein n=1 Tax=Paenibacillus sp. Soil787 TaxID=1736411 RepID=UPI000703B21A|nr:beta-L-arabinofuranosidase domain-containing protein [Paenibacillus sp. Soil787]KRF19371.1 hypothetical protein ASG93_32420 [Paenibacillus sp. Soil787]